MSYRFSDEGFSRGFLTLRAFYFIGQKVCRRMGWHFRLELLLRLYLVLPTILFEVCQQVKIWFLFKDFVLAFDSFLQDRRNEPAFTV